MPNTSKPSKKAAIIAAKLANPDATVRTIADQTGTSHPAVVRTLHEAREKGLLMTDKQTQDFFTKGVLEDFARYHMRALAVHADDFDHAQGVAEQSKGTAAELEARKYRRDMAKELSSMAARGLSARVKVLGEVGAENESASATFNGPVQIVFNRSDKKPMAPISRESGQGSTQPA